MTEDRKLDSRAFAALGLHPQIGGFRPKHHSFRLQAEETLARCLLGASNRTVVTVGIRPTGLTCLEDSGVQEDQYLRQVSGRPVHLPDTPRLSTS